VLHSILAKTVADSSAAEVSGTFSPSGDSEINRYVNDPNPEVIAQAAVAMAVGAAGEQLGYTKWYATQWRSGVYIKRRHNVFGGAAAGEDIIQHGRAIWPLPVPVTMHQDEDLNVLFKLDTASVDQGLILYLSYGNRITSVDGAVRTLTRRVTGAAQVVDSWKEAATTITDLDPKREYLLIGGQVTPDDADGTLAARITCPSFSGMKPMIPVSGNIEMLPEFMPVSGNETLTVEFYGGVTAKTPVVDLVFAEFPPAEAGVAGSGESPASRPAVNNPAMGGGGGGGGLAPAFGGGGGFNLGSILGGF